MISNQLYRRFMSLLQSEETLQSAADKAGIDVTTARKYRDAGVGPDELKQPHNWRTRENSFALDWPVATDMFENNPGLEAKTVFEFLQREHPGRYGDSKLRTFQRHVKTWRALFGPEQEVYFDQVHTPGQWGASDFTSMNKLGITINRAPFEHLLYHFVLTYSNWEDVTICYSETFESLSEGLQNALNKLGGVPQKHKTDRLSAAWKNAKEAQEYTARYDALANHYGFTASKTNPGSPHENGDNEQAHHRLHRAVSQSLMLRGSKDFNSIDEYKIFLYKIIVQCNSNRQERFKEEVAVLKRLPLKRLDARQTFDVRVTQGSTISVKSNVYSVHSRLIGQKVKVYVYSDHIDIWYSQQKIDTLPRLLGRGKANINYRHIITYLVRKPGAFAQYRYRSCLYPTTPFRIAYDILQKNNTELAATKQYLKILNLAATENEDLVNSALSYFIKHEKQITDIAVKAHMNSITNNSVTDDPEIDQINLCSYDQLLEVALHV